MGYLGKNLEFLRKLNHETQSDIAELLNVNQNTIYYYEKEQRRISNDSIQKLAEHFSVTPAEMQYEPLESNFNRIHNLFEFDGLLDDKNLPLYIYPIVHSKKALQNEDFQMALNAHKKIMKWIIDPNTEFSESVFEEVTEGYQRSAEAGILEAKANIISFFFIIYTFSFAMEFFGDEISEDIADKQIFDTLLKSFIFQKDSPTKKDFHNVVIDEVLPCVFDLKLSGGSYAELSDFYLSFLYMYNLVRDNLSNTESQLIGREIFSLAVDMGNKYVVRCLDLLDKYRS